MQPIATDVVAWSACVCLFVKTAEPIEMRFGELTRVGPRNHVLDRIEIPTGSCKFLGVKV